MFETVRTPDDWASLLEASAEHPVMVLKHSTRCAVSTWAQEEFRSYAESAAERGTRCAVVLVVEDRAVSREIADSLGVPHRSPQAILVHERSAVWHTSHEGVTTDALARAEAERVAGGS